MSDDDPEQYGYFAIDIEMAGAQMLTYPIVAVGYCIGDVYGNIRMKKRYNIDVGWPHISKDGKLDYGNFEPKTWNEFWIKQDIESFKIDCVSIVSALEYMQKDLSDLCACYKKVVILSDNPSFDIGNIDLWRSVELDRLPLRYVNNKYMDVVNPDDVLSAFDKEVVDNLCESFKNLHDHNPANDAEQIYQKMVMVRALLEE